MTELTITILKYIFLLALLVFAWFAIHSLHRDIIAVSGISGRKNHKNKKKESNAPIPITPVPSAPTANPKANEPSLLVVIDGPLAGSTIPLTGMPVTLGRAPTNRVVLDDEYVSSTHAQIFFDAVTHLWMLEDLGSTNGTYVNGQRLNGTTPLYARTPVRIGATTFELR
jgi:pSer/pThr/pTyr-binding forkhead associated (FHA) protein